MPTYNAAGRMVRAESVTGTLLVYTYTADGLRVAQAVDGDVTTFAWDWASGVPEMLSDGESLYLVGHDTLGRFVDGEWAYHLPDALGSVRQVADGAGSVVSSREWTPFGLALSRVEGLEMGVARPARDRAETPPRRKPAIDRGTAGRRMGHSGGGLRGHQLQPRPPALSGSQGSSGSPEDAPALVDTHAIPGHIR